MSPLSIGSLAAFYFEIHHKEKKKHTKSRSNRALCMGIGLLLIGATSGHADENLFAAQEMFTGHRYAAGLVHLRKAAETGDRDARLACLADAQLSSISQLYLRQKIETEQFIPTTVCNSSFSENTHKRGE